jgi:hypothetical protein
MRSQPKRKSVLDQKTLLLRTLGLRSARQVLQELEHLGATPIEYTMRSCDRHQEETDGQ